MPLDTFTVGLTIDDFPEFCGPEDLSDAIISLRKSERDIKWLAPISDDGIRRLFKLAYYTSLAPEEGRYPRFRLICVDTAPDNIFFAASFNTPINNVESLRRLAPAASETGGALLVTECNGTLLCNGSIIINTMGFGTMIGRPELLGVERGSPSLIVRVDGPGRLRASEELYTLLLDHGRIRQVVNYWVVRQVGELWKDLAVQMIESTASIYGAESRISFGGPRALAELIHKAWSRVLALAIDRRHGGAFVVLPTMGKPDTFDIRCKYPAQMNFGDDILQFWQSCVSYAAVRDEREREDVTRAWNWRRAAMFTKAGILAGLSLVDGCVVLDRHLQVLGFGGEIRVDDEKVRTAPRALRNGKTGQLTPEDELEQMGTRHRSAYRLAKVHPGTIVFVISQEGDLRIFCSDKSDVFGFDDLHAWTYRYEST